MTAKQSLRSKDLKKEVKSDVIPSEVEGSSKLENTTRTGKIATSPKAPRNDTLSIPVYSLLGKEAGTMDLPKEIFGAPVNKKLLAQALRVYMANQKTLPGSTKTRGEINATKAKVWRQKGTGRARHGAKSAPIFVGGGVAFGPKPRNISLDLPKKMKHAALLSALSAKALDQDIVGINGLDKATGKTKEMALFVSALREKSKGKSQKSESVLIVISEKQDNVTRAVRNIDRLNVLPVAQLNAYEILKHHTLILTKESVEKLAGDKKGAEKAN